jgi:hypothetical protein
MASSRAGTSAGRSNALDLDDNVLLGTVRNRTDAFVNFRKKGKKFTSNLGKRKEDGLG